MQSMQRNDEVRAWSSPYWAEIHILVRREDSRGKFIGQPVVMRQLTNQQEATYSEPTFRMEPETAQVLMDDLWRCGLRPSEGTGSAGALAATQRHLEDFRKIAFKQLGII